MKAKCKCGKLTVRNVTGTLGSVFQMGCPLCHSTITVKV